MGTEPLSTAAIAAIRARQANKSVEMLMGMVTGMVADSHLHDMEIQLGSPRLTGNTEAVSWR